MCYFHFGNGIRNGTISITQWVFVTVKSTKLEGLRETFDIEPIVKESAPRLDTVMYI